MIEYTAMAAVGVASILVALFVNPRYVGLAGFTYMFLSIVGMAHGRWERYRLERMPLALR
jgi:hypothetical protein